MSLPCKSSPNPLSFSAKDKLSLRKKHLYIRPLDKKERESTKKRRGSTEKGATQQTKARLDDQGRNKMQKMMDSLCIIMSMKVSNIVRMELLPHLEFHK